jgi:putative aldouronate transport system substrate-binding protein
MKKLISLVTAGMLAMSLAACGSSGSGSAAAGGSSASSEPTTVTVYCMSFNNIPEDSEVTRIENLMNDYLAKTYPDDNIAIDIKLFGPAEYTQKVQLAMQSGDKIDAFFERALANDVASDMLAPMNDLLEKYGQEVTAKLKEDFDENPYTATTINGTIYAVPANKGMALNGNLIWDDDIAQAAGVDMSTVSSIEDLEAVFEQVHAYDPNIVCYAPNNQGDTSLIRPILRSEEKIDCLNDTDYYAGVSMNGDSTVTNLYASDAFMEKCKLMREWNQKGYLQADAATTTSTAPELFSAGRCFSTIDAYGGDSAGAVLSLSSGHNLKSKILYNFYFDSASVYVDFGIASTSKVPEAAMKMINRLWTDEYLINTFLYGEEGVDYVKPDADHWAYPDGKDATTVGYTAALSTGVIGSESLQYQPVGTDIADIQLKLKHNKESERSPFFGFMFDASGVTTEMSAIANVYNQYVPGLICGTVDPETTMPEFLNALDAAGINTVIQAKQEQLDAWIAAQK